MVILLTNDDGIESPGLAALSEALSPDHEVWTVAPDSDRSGRSHAITLHQPVRMKEFSDTSFACSGSPADCVLYSLRGAIKVKPDVVVSGINLGPNLGTDIIYSGTAAAARQASLMKVPGIAVSQAQSGCGFKLAAEFIKKNLESLVNLWHEDHFINVNMPCSKSGKISGVAITSPARRKYNDSVLPFKAPNGDTFYFLQGDLIESDDQKETDWEAIKDEKISVSPVYLHPVNHSEDKAYLDTVFRL